jgi:hypothetical protein
MEASEGMRRQAEQKLASRLTRPVDRNEDRLARRFASKEQQLEYERIVREYYSLLARARAKRT